LLVELVDFVIVVVGRKARTGGELFVKYGSDPDNYLADAL